MTARADADRRRCSSCAASPSASSSRSTSPRRIARRARRAASREEVVHAVDDVDLAVAPRRGGRAGRRIGLRQVDARPHRGRPAAAVRRRALLARRSRCAQLDAATRARQQLKHADDLPGPVRVAQSAHARRRHRRRGAGRARPRSTRGEQADYVGRMLMRVGLDPTLMRRFPHQFSGGQRSAHRHRARAGGEARVPGLRRGGRGARRVDPGAGAQPVHGAARRAGPHLPLHQPRPRRGRSTSPTAWSSCTSAASSRSAPTARAVRARRTIRTRRRCSPRCRASSRASARSCRSRARSPRRSIRRPAAISIRAARTPCARCRDERAAAASRSRRDARPRATSNERLTA